MRTSVFILILQWCLLCTAQNQVVVSISNPTTFDRSDELVEIPLSKIKAKISIKKNETYIVKNANGKFVASQITYDNKLIFQCGLQPKAAAKFTITGGIAQEYVSKVAGIFYPERKDDFVWENDQVGFRFYGNALKYSDGPSNGLDLWYKRTNTLVLKKWYYDALNKNIWFHTDRGEGCDPYAVGRSLGAGAMAPHIQGKLILNENFIRQEFLDNGPLRFTARLEYPDFEVDGQSTHESRIVSLDAGSQLTKITEDYGTVNFSVASGIIKRSANEEIIKNLKSNYCIYVEPETKENGRIYVGIYFPTGLDSVSMISYHDVNPVNKTANDYTHIIGISKYKAKPLSYYTGFGWSKFGFSTSSSFQKYMDEFVTQKKYPLKIKYIKQ